MDMVGTDRLSNGVTISQFQNDWLAVINVGNWHYSQIGKTRQAAIYNLFVYMNRSKVMFEDRLQIFFKQLRAINEFLETKSSIYVHEFPQDEIPWIASHCVGVVCMCNGGGQTRQDAIDDLIVKVQAKKLQTEQDIEMDKYRLKTLNDFLEAERF